MSDTTYLEMLLGEWVAEDQSTALGGFSFQADLQNTIYIRRNHASYVATAETPAYEHDDILIVYTHPLTKQLAAWYTDNEGHVIEYDVRFIEDTQTIEFLSAESLNSPRYRLRYTPISANQLRIAFAIAPPGQAEAFVSYIESSVHRFNPASEP